MEANDVDLWSRWVHGGDAEAFHEILRRHGGIVYGVCRRILGNDADAEDVSQECFFEVARARGAPRDSVAGWLHSLATHRALDFLKGARRRRRREGRAAVPPAAAAPAAGDLEWTEIRPHLDAAIAALPRRLHRVVVAHFLEQKTQAAVAAELGLTPQAVSHRCRRAIEHLRRHLARRGVRAGSAALGSSLAAGLGEPLPAAVRGALGKVTLAGLAGSPALPVAGALVVGGLLLPAAKVWTTTALAAGLVVAAGIGTWTSRGARMHETIEERPRLAAAPAAVDTAARNREASAVSTPPAGGREAVPLDPTRVLRGRVVDAADVPVPGARVAAGVAGEDTPLAEATTDATGAFALAFNGAGAYLVRACDGDRGLHPGLVAVTGADPVALELTPFARLEGHLLDASSGAPIESGVPLTLAHRAGALDGGREARIALRWFYGTTRSGATRTAELRPGGAYRFARLTAGEYQVSVAPGVTAWLAPGAPGASAIDVRLAPGEARTGFDIALELGCAIAGTVRAPGGEPLAGASVHLLATPWPLHDRAAQTTEADGGYRFDGLAAGASYLVVVDREPYAQSYSEEARLNKAGDVATADIAMVAPGVTLEGTVVADDGAPVAGVRLRLARRFGQLHSSFGREPATSDAAGTFTFAPVAPAEYSITLDHDGFDDSVSRRLDVPPGGLSEPFRITLKGRRFAGVVAGRVTDAAGRPLALVRVEIDREGPGPRLWRQVHTPADGTYLFDGVGAADRFTVSLRPPARYVSQERKGVALGTRDVDFTLEPAASVAGRVVDSRTGEPVESFEVRARSFRSSVPGGYAERWIAFRNDEGEFLLDGVEPPLASVEVRAAGFRPYQSERFEAVADERIELAARLEPAASFAGRVVDFTSGRALRGVRVLAYDEDAFPVTVLLEREGAEGHFDHLFLARAVTGEDGRFDLDTLPPGKIFDLALWHESYGTRVLSRLTAPDELALTLAPAARVVALLRRNGAPAAGGFGVYHDADHDWATGDARAFRAGQVADLAGRVTLEGLPPGRFLARVTARPEGRQVGVLELELEPGETRELTLDLDKLAARMGSVRGEAPASSPEVSVRIQSRERPSAWVYGSAHCTVEEREFALEGLPAGRYDLHVVDRSALREVEVTLDVTAGEALDVDLERVLEEAR